MRTPHLFVGLLVGGAPLAAAQTDHVDAAGAPAPAPVSQDLVFDDLSVVHSPSESAALLDGSLRDVTTLGSAREGRPIDEPHDYTGPMPPKVDPQQELFSRYSVESLLSEPLYDETSSSDHVWTRVRRMKASFGADGFVAFPAFGRSADQSHPVRFQLKEVSVGGRAIPFEGARTTRLGDRVTLDRESVREVYNVSLDGIEQTFVFDGLPAGGDLVVNVDVDSSLGVLQDEEGIHFVHGELGGITYGDAFVVDASGERQSIERIWTGSSIELTVPASFLSSATFPVTIDPPVTAFTSTAGVADDSNVDLCYTGESNVYWAVFQDYFDGTQSDVYAVSFDLSGTVEDFITIEFGADDWTEPKIAYHVGSDRCLAVASEVQSGTGNGSIQGQLIDCAAGTVTGSQFTISSIGAMKVHPDVGGNNWDSTSNSHFLVAWSSIWTAGSVHQVQYRVINWDGASVTGLTSVTDFTAGEVHNEPAISETHGDGDLFGDFWTLVWTFDADNNGFGSIIGRRVTWSGNAALGAGNFTVANGPNCSHPRVSSRFNRNLLSVSDRPSIVVYERDFATVSGTPPRQRSIYGRVVSDGAVAGPEEPISWQLEDFDHELDQREPAIACDGNCFYLIYTEGYYGNIGGGDYDMYMLSGCLSDRLDGARIALAERHENMAFSGSAERNGAVATAWDGSSNSASDDGMAIWEDQNVTNGGTLEGYTLEIPTLNQSIRRAVGRQYCDANPNSGNGQFGRQSSWSWLLGDQSVGSTHSFYCTDQPLGVFGYSLISRTSADINMPAGQLGRLCVAGAGRYVDQVVSSGTTGQTVTTITPLSVPSPTGFVGCQVGETWYFQHWHRDSAMGAPQSNFSTACEMQFTN